jgi:hypothetical protein
MKRVPGFAAPALMRVTSPMALTEEIDTMSDSSINISVLRVRTIHGFLEFIDNTLEVRCKCGSRFYSLGVLHNHLTHVLHEGIELQPTKVVVADVEEIHG